MILPQKKWKQWFASGKPILLSHTHTSLWAIPGFHESAKKRMRALNGSNTSKKLESSQDPRSLNSTTSLKGIYGQESMSHKPTLSGCPERSRQTYTDHAVSDLLRTTLPMRHQIMYIGGYGSKRGDPLWTYQTLREFVFLGMFIKIFWWWLVQYGFLPACK